MGSNCLVTMTQQEIETCQTSPEGRGILKSKVGRGCSPHTSVMQDRRCMKVIRAPPDSVWAKHHRIVGASRSTVEQVHVTTATAKETSRTVARVSNLRTAATTGLTLEKELCQLCQQQGWRVGRCSVQRVLRCENFLKAFGQGVIPRVANIRNWQTGQLTALRRWERVKSRQTSSDSAKVKTTCEDRPLPLATWLRSANRTASRGTTVNRVLRVVVHCQTCTVSVARAKEKRLWSRASSSSPYNSKAFDSKTLPSFTAGCLFELFSEEK